MSASKRGRFDAWEGKTYVGLCIHLESHGTVLWYVLSGNVKRNIDDQLRYVNTANRMD